MRVLVGSALLLALVGCDRPSVGGALVINNTNSKITVTVIDGDYGPFDAEPGLDAMAIATPGPKKVRIDLPDGEKHTITIDFKLDTMAMVSAKPGTCMALADYTDQYGGEGKIEVTATTGPDKHGTLERIPENAQGPLAPLPRNRVEDRPIIRFTEVPCDVLDDPEALQRHLYSLD